MEEDFDWYHKLKDDAKVPLFFGKSGIYLGSDIPIQRDRYELVQWLSAAEARLYGPKTIDTLIEKTVTEVPSIIILENEYIPLWCAVDYFFTNARYIQTYTSELEEYLDDLWLYYMTRKEIDVINSLPAEVWISYM